MKKSLLLIDANEYPLLLLLFVSATFFLTSFACSNGGCQMLESCSSATDCALSLYCGNCAQSGKNQPFCIRGQANVPTAIIDGLPFNKYTWLVTHNAFSIVDAPLLQSRRFCHQSVKKSKQASTTKLPAVIRVLLLELLDLVLLGWVIIDSYHLTVSILGSFLFGETIW